MQSKNPFLLPPGILNYICFLLLLTLLLSGCREAPSPVLSTSTAAAHPTPKPTDTRLTLTSCTVDGIKAECGYLHVPEDRNNPDGRILDLRIVVVRAFGSDRQPDPFFYFAGGPGVAATTVTGIAKSIFYEINAHRDIVFLDQRGTNDRHMLACKLPSFNFSEATQQQVDDWIKQCLPSLDGDPRFLTTAAAMRDLDEARAALGYDKINLYGISYGAAAAQVYMRMFPERVRTAVLDHGTALDLPFFYAKPTASQSALDQIFTYCEQDEKCHAAYPDIRGDWKTVLDRLAKGPVVTSYQPDGATEPAALTMAGLADGVHQLMYKSGAYVQLPFLIHTLAASEDWTPVVKSYNEQYGSSSAPAETYNLMPEVIFCFEPAWGYDPGEIARLNPGSYYRDLEVEWAKNEQKLCKAMPKPDPSLIYGPGEPVPLSALMLNSLIDPQNPPSNMDLALKEFTKSRLVVEPTEGHDTSSSYCRWHLVAQYVKQGSVDESDTACFEKQQPFFVTGND
jgi:pimeloyl-ACP methyl ester carboxylesterase